MNTEEPLNLVLLQTFYEVALTGSVTAAAQRIGRSQPAVSHRLRNLERELGVRLFEKVGRKLKLTHAGEKLQVECLDLMARSHGIRERVAGTEGRIAGRVTLGTHPTVGSHLLVPALAKIFDKHEEIVLQLQFGFADELFRRLRVGELDLLVVIGEDESQGLEFERVGEVSIVAVMARDQWPRTGALRITPEGLKEHRYLSFGGERDATFSAIDGYAREHGLVETQTPEVPHIETLRNLAATGAGYALLPEYTTRRDCADGRLVALHPDGLDVRLPVSLVGRRDQEGSAALDAVRSHLLEELHRALRQ